MTYAKYVKTAKRLFVMFEWAGLDDEKEYCPVCCANKPDGHKAGCRLDAMLKETPE